MDILSIIICIGIFLLLSLFAGLNTYFTAAVQAKENEKMLKRRDAEKAALAEKEASTK